MKTDIRSRYTKEVIGKAFLKLLDKKAPERITVSDICREARISRPTFYFYYQDIYALLDEILDGVIAEARLEQMVQLTMREPDSVYQAILHVIEVIEKNFKLYCECFLEQGAENRMSVKVTEALNNTLIREWTEKGLLPGNVDREYFTGFMQSGFNALIRHWADKGEGRESASELAKLTEKFLLYGLLGVVREGRGAAKEKPSCN